MGDESALKNINRAASAAKFNALTIGLMVEIDHIAADAGVFCGCQTVYNAVVGNDIHSGSQRNDAFVNGNNTVLNKGSGSGCVVNAAVTCGVSRCGHALGTGEIDCCSGSEYQRTAAVLVLFHIPGCLALSE